MNPEMNPEWTAILEWINTLNCPIEMRIQKSCAPKAYLHHEYLFEGWSAWLIFFLGKISRRLVTEVGLSFWPFLGERYTLFTIPWYKMRR